MAASFMVVAVPASPSWASAEIRFVQAIPGTGSAELSAGGGTSIGGNVGFGHVSSYVGVPAGSHELSLSSGSKKLTTTKVDLSDGQRYTVVAMAQGKGAQLRPFTDGKPSDGKARLRLIHAAPELGSPDVRLDGQTVAEKVRYTQATPYLTVRPGSYTIEVMKPGSGGGKPIVEKHGVALAAGTSSTSFLIGTRGEPTQVAVATDRSVAPSRAPKTGLAPLASSGRPWATIGLIALLAGLLGGAVQLLIARRRAGAR